MTQVLQAIGFITICGTIGLIIISCIQNWCNMNQITAIEKRLDELENKG